MMQVKIVSDGAVYSPSGGTKIYLLHEDQEIDISEIVQAVAWSIDVADGLARGTLLIPRIALEVRGDLKGVIREALRGITTVPLRCKCGWSGTVYDAVPDVDGDGSLGCPDCDRLLDSRIPSPPPSQPRDKAHGAW